MSAIPSRRLLVYVVLGVVVLAVGTLTIISMRGAGSTAAEAELVISGAGEQAVSVPTTEVSTTTTSLRTIFVQVTGAIRRPGVYEVVLGSRVFQAIETAGGFSEDADREAVALAAEVSDGSRIYVPVEGELPPDTVVGPAAQSTSGTSVGVGPVSINSADLQALDSLPGVGPATAQKIIDYREANGPFGSVEELSEVPGIGPAKLEQIRPLVGL